MVTKNDGEEGDVDGPAAANASEGASSSFQSDRRLIRLLIARYWADVFQKRYIADQEEKKEWKLMQLVLENSKWTLLTITFFNDYLYLWNPHLYMTPIARRRIESQLAEPPQLAEKSGIHN
jgi:hypothetical protein